MSVCVGSCFAGVAFVVVEVRLGARHEAGVYRCYVVTFTCD